ncbi:MAG TPA: hypothetical protein VD902_18180 [Symbiobacteriaceae bacterium]|nr:hypothetical protein [Symbiobacteriaceae bacterium]
MSKRVPAPVVRQSIAPDPELAKVQAALEVWRRALAGKMARCTGKSATPENPPL